MAWYLIIQHNTSSMQVWLLTFIGSPSTSSWKHPSTKTGTVTQQPATSPLLIQKGLRIIHVLLQEFDSSDRCCVRLFGLKKKITLHHRPPHLQGRRAPRVFHAFTKLWRRIRATQKEAMVLFFCSEVGHYGDPPWVIHMETLHFDPRSIWNSSATWSGALSDCVLLLRIASFADQTYGPSVPH